ncbi:MAG TPA: VOC family protein [Bryobacterales bacterium]|nr:VOC family protein [Bryobacterales bacterium]
MSNNRLNRREMLMLAGAAAIRPAHADAPLLRPRRIDHVSLAVTDVDQAMIFYRRLFGNEVLKENKTPRRYIRLGPGYASIAPAASGQAVRIDHYCAGIDDFQGNALKSSLASAGIPVRGSGGGLFVTDPDGTSLQLMADGSWTHLGSNAGPETGLSGEPLFRARGMHHLAIRVSNMERSTEFYRKLFGPEVRRQGDPPQP